MSNRKYIWSLVAILAVASMFSACSKKTNQKQTENEIMDTTEKEDLPEQSDPGEVSLR